MNDKTIEQGNQDKGLTAPRVTPQDIGANITGRVYFTAADGYRNSPCYDPNGHVHEPLPAPAPLELLTFHCRPRAPQRFHRHRRVRLRQPRELQRRIGRKVARQNAVQEVVASDGLLPEGKAGKHNYGQPRPLIPYT